MRSPSDLNSCIANLNRMFKQKKIQCSKIKSDLHKHMKQAVILWSTHIYFLNLCLGFFSHFILLLQARYTASQSFAFYLAADAFSLLYLIHITPLVTFTQQFQIFLKSHQLSPSCTDIFVHSMSSLIALHNAQTSSVSYMSNMQQPN